MPGCCPNGEFCGGSSVQREVAKIWKFAVGDDADAPSARSKRRENTCRPAKTACGGSFPWRRRVWRFCTVAMR